MVITQIEFGQNLTLKKTVRLPYLLVKGLKIKPRKNHSINKPIGLETALMQIVVHDNLSKRLAVINEMYVSFVLFIHLLNVILTANVILTCEQTTQFRCIEIVKK